MATSKATIEAISFIVNYQSSRAGFSGILCIGTLCPRMVASIGS
jgi:hypothetical protein